MSMLWSKSSPLFHKRDRNFDSWLSLHTYPSLLLNIIFSKLTCHGSCSLTLLISLCVLFHLESFSSLGSIFLVIFFLLLGWCLSSLLHALLFLPSFLRCWCFRVSVGLTSHWAISSCPVPFIRKRMTPRISVSLLSISTWISDRHPSMFKTELISFPKPCVLPVSSNSIMSVLSPK